jgi:hypothetical protein
VLRSQRATVRTFPCPVCFEDAARRLSDDKREFPWENVRFSLALARLVRPWAGF